MSCVNVTLTCLGLGKGDPLAALDLGELTPKLS